MFRRDLAIAFCSRVTWVAAAVAALVVGHGFVLALDLFDAASRAVASNALMSKELDPLSGVVRPMLGGCQLVTAVLVPIVCARLLAVEKERNTFGAMSLIAGSPGRVVRSKLVVAAAAGGLALVAPAALLASFVAIGGHLDALETTIALFGHVLHVVLVAAASVAAAAWTRSVAQATTLAVVLSLASWAVEAGEGFAALAWLGPFEAASVSRQLAAFESGILHVGALVWFATMLVVAGLGAWLGGRFDLSTRLRAAAGAVLVAVMAFGVLLSTRIHRAHDWTELARASLPPAGVTALRELREPIEIVVWMDREDSRRRQLERDTLAKLRLARADLRISMPLDGVSGSSALAHDDDYGRVVVRVGDRERTTRSISRREVVTLIFDATGRPLPDWSQSAYPGYPLVLEPQSRAVVRVTAYGVVPSLLLSIGWLLSRRRRHR